MRARALRPSTRYNVLQAICVPNNIVGAKESHRALFWVRSRVSPRSIDNTFTSSIRLAKALNEITNYFKPNKLKAGPQVSENLKKIVNLDSDISSLCKVSL